VRTSELARRVGIAPSAVRWYEEVGVLPKALRGANGYRDYDEADLRRLRLVVSLRHLGLDPLEAGRLAARCLDGDADPGLVDLIARQRAAIAASRSELDRLDGELVDLAATLRIEPHHEQPTTVEHVRPIRVLFVCTGNSGRSQLAEALLCSLGGPAFEVFSAGTNPRPVSLFAIDVLDEIGIDWRGATSKPVEPWLGQRFDYVITVCDRAKESCPVFPGAENTLHWGLDDPAEVIGADAERRAAYGRTRDELLLRLPPFIEIARRAARHRSQLAS
jgi:arsenate reductase